MPLFDAARLAAAFDAADGALWLIDRQGRISDPESRRRFPVPDLAALPDPAGRIFAAALRDRAPARLDVALGPEDARQHLALRFAPTSAGGAAGILFARDITRERLLEAQLGQAQRLQAVGELAAGIAHDFNNLLTAIVGAADDLRARAPEGDHADLEQIRASADRGAALVRQLLAFSRQQTLQPRVIDLNAAVHAAASMLRRLLGARVELVLALEEPGRAVRIDPTQLDQILVNLAVNAANAMRGGGRVTIATGHRVVLRPQSAGAETIPAGRYATLAVRDTGAGIPPHVLPRIFEPFFTTRRAQGGTGLGLATVHGIVRQSEGYIEVESTPDVGTCFTLLFPRHEPALPASTVPAAAQTKLSAPPPSEPAPAPGGKLLLVEDEGPIRKLAERALARAGWQVIACDCGQSALATISGQEDDLTAVVSDVVMPGMDGPALVTALRERRPALPAVLMSGYADGITRQELARNDVIFVAKPFAMRDLMTALDRARGAAAESE